VVGVVRGQLMQLLEHAEGGGQLLWIEAGVLRGVHWRNGTAEPGASPLRR
jgi:hypothetical protein